MESIFHAGFEKIANRIITHFKLGFTLIELMIVVAIIGVLAIIALPEYEEYQIKAKISEAILSASECKLRATELINFHGKGHHTPCYAGIKNSHYVNYRHFTGETILVGINENVLGHEAHIVLVPYSVNAAGKKVSYQDELGKMGKWLPVQGWVCAASLRRNGAPNIQKKYLLSGCISVDDQDIGLDEDAYSQGGVFWDLVNQ